MDKETLEKINALTRREFTEEELYTFPVVLCHNDIDRDGERFSDDALDAMAELFIGKTGIFDHNATADNQSARIYDTEVITDPERETAWGGAYRYLKGYAYMVKTSANADLITEIDAGIKKEVSVSCSAAQKTCSICGKSLYEGECEHKRGEVYDGQVCHAVLDAIADAYEWSFVAVPAQVGAGVTAKARSPRGHHSPNAPQAAQRSNQDTASPTVSGGDVNIIKSTTEGGKTMEDFTPITTKAAFDSAAQPLIDAAVTAKAAEFEGWLSPEGRAQLETAHKAELRKAYCEKAALLYGLPKELAERLTGETEEDIEKDAQLLSMLTKRTQETPHFQGEIPPAESMEGELLEMLRAMRNA